MARRERRVVRSISGQNGTLTDDAGAVVKVRFSLTQWQDFIDNLPTLRSAEGSLEFKDTQEAWRATDGKLRTLTGGGIRASIYVVSSKTFKVTGPVIDT